MSSPAAPTRRRSAALPRPSLLATVLRIAAVSAVAAVLIWSVLFVELLQKHADSTALARPAGQLTSPDPGQPAPPPASVTTRTS